MRNSTRSGRKAKYSAHKRAPKHTFVDLQARLAANVRRLRAELGLTQIHTAERAQLGARHYQKIEAAEINATLNTLAQLGRALECDPVELLAAPKGGRR